MGKGPRIDCSGDEPLTQQSGKEDADINNIVERAKRGAVLPVNDRVPMYGDFTSIPKDLRECMVIVTRANEVFMNLDAQVRKRFENDPAQMLDFLNDSKNRDEAIALGLVKAPPVVVPDPIVEEIKNLGSIVRESSGAKKSKPKADDE